VGRYQEKETTENLAVDRKEFVKPETTPFFKVQNKKRMDDEGMR
jgi:hypothetical protein